MLRHMSFIVDEAFVKSSCSWRKRGETDASVASIAYSQEVTLNLQYPE